MDAWEVLLDAGVPARAARPPAACFVDEVAAALGRIRVDQLETWQREALHAWLRAWRSHFPTSYKNHLGSTGDRLVATTDSIQLDPNRYLKLRRIAVENLSHWL